jgi:hypothetical protein
MKVDVQLSLAGTSAPVVAKFQPLAATGGVGHGAHKH